MYAGVQTNHSARACSAHLQDTPSCCRTHAEAFCTCAFPDVQVQKFVQRCYY